MSPTLDWEKAIGVKNWRKPLPHPCPEYPEVTNAIKTECLALIHPRQWERYRKHSNHSLPSSKQLRQDCGNWKAVQRRFAYDAKMNVIQAVEKIISEPGELITMMSAGTWDRHHVCTSSFIKKVIGKDWDGVMRFFDYHKRIEVERKVTCDDFYRGFATRVVQEFDVRRNGKPASVEDVAACLSGAPFRGLF